MFKAGRYVLFLSALLFGLSACGLMAPRLSVEKPEVPGTEAGCLAKGGHWTTLGLPMPDKPKTCDLKATDAGRPCVDGSQCQGECVAPEAATSGDKARGQCSAYLSDFGNVLRVSHGTVEAINIE